MAKSAQKCFTDSAAYVSGQTMESTQQQQHLRIVCAHIYVRILWHHHHQHGHVQNLFCTNLQILSHSTSFIRGTRDK